MDFTKHDVWRKIRHRGANGAVFQFRDIRMGVGANATDRNAHSRVYGYLKALRRDGVVVEVDSDRKRNKYYRLADEQKLASLLNSLPVGENGRGNRTGEQGDMFEARTREKASSRLARIEQAIRLVEDQNSRIEGKLDELIAVWS